MVERVILVHGDRGQAVDGIRDHTARLVEELSRRPLVAAELRLRATASPAGRSRVSTRLWRELRRLDGSSAVVLQYSPFCYGRRGFAPWLPVCLLAARGRSRRPAVALMVHEAHVPMISWRWTLMGLWQRLQLGALRLSADVVLTSIEPWARRLGAQPPRRPTHHLPVGSNFPDARRERDGERRRLGVGEETLVVACLGRDHPGWRGEYVVGAVNAIVRGGRPLTLLNLGAETPPLAGLDPAVAVHAPGYLEAAQFAARLSAADLFLVPASDGVSTRRGSLMVALQHGLAVVGTAGPSTDSVLREAGPALRLTAVDDRERFAGAALRLAEDPAARAAAGTAARELYEREFDWPVVAAGLLAALGER